MENWPYLGDDKRQGKVTINH